MRNVMKAATLESKFPLLSVEEGCIISKDADITVAYLKCRSKERLRKLRSSRHISGL